MSKHVIARRRDALELIERLLNTTALTTKQISHQKVIGLGEDLIQKTTVDVDGEKQKAVEEALEKAEQRHTRELRGALRRQEHKFNEDKERSMQKQKTHYEELAKRVAEQRDKAEEERARQLRKKFDAEKAAALQEQWEECERLKEEAIQEACTALRKKLRDEFAWEKEKAIADALAHAREKFRLRELATIARTKAECEEEFARVLQGVREAHEKEMKKQQHRYDVLETNYNKELKHRMRVESDFKALQEDYSRFMNYTDGQFHSDYLMKLRYSGDKLSKKKISVVSVCDIDLLKM